MDRSTADQGSSDVCYRFRTQDLPMSASIQVFWQPH